MHLRQGRSPTLALFSVAALVYALAAPWENLDTPLGTPTQLAGLLLLGTWVIAWATGLTRLQVHSPVAILLALLFVWTIATSLWSAAPMNSLVTGISRALLALSALAISSIPPELFFRFIQALAISCGVMALKVLSSQPEPGGYDGLTFDGIDQNILAFNLAIGLACALYQLMLASERPILLLNASLVVVIAISIVLTGSRTGLVSIAAVVGLTVFVGLRGRRLAFVLLVLAVVVASWWLVLLSGRVPERIMGFLAAPVTMDSRALIIDRYLAFRDAWEVWGIGAGADADFLSKASGYYKNAHSGFWKTWVELGVIGVVITGALIVACIAHARKSPARHLLLIATGAVVPFMYTLGPINSNVLWVLVGLCLLPTAQGIQDRLTARVWTGTRGSP